MHHLTVKKKKIFWRSLYELEIQHRGVGSRVDIPQAPAPESTSLLELRATIDLLEKRLATLEQLVLHQSPAPPASSPVGTGQPPAASSPVSTGQPPAASSPVATGQPPAASSPVGTGQRRGASRPTLNLSYSLLDRVEVLQRDVWHQGIVRAIVANNRYKVKLVDTSEEADFMYWDVRPSTAPPPASASRPAAPAEASSSKAVRGRGGTKRLRKNSQYKKSPYTSARKNKKAKK
ncbi:hypothetical protein EUTSA_v10023671mg [Eutrema salsugineum]|uniref:Agenet domain-containing protein n=1 Tax=Eutrema salsugineum TaxID=72664 RepID=V4JWH7_EUTSA|nr:hypothetical protein EUTSA_v10023671mg [Eutrema salsugineum]